MTAGAPWSVKGIDPKAREVAKDLARRSGMTLGEWLNRVILEDDVPEEVTSEAAFDRPRRSYEDAPRLRVLSGAPPHDLARVAQALDRLTERIESSETRTGLAISGVEHSVRQALARIETTEREHLAVARRMEQGDDEQARLAERLRRLEAETSGPRSAEALRVLEDRIARTEAAQTGGDGQAMVDAVLDRLGERLAGAEARTAAALDDLRRALSALDGRLGEVEQGAQAVAERRFESLAAALAERVEQARAEVAEKLQASAAGQVEARLADMAAHVAAAERRSAQALERMGHEVLRIAEVMNRRLGGVERHSAEAVDRVGGEVARIAGAIEGRLSRAEQVQAETLERLGAEIGRVSDRLSEQLLNSERRAAQAIEDVGEQVTRVTERLEQRHERAAVDLAERIRQSEERIERLLDEARRRTGASEAAAATPVAEPELKGPFGPELFSRAEPDLDVPIFESPRPSISAEDLEAADAFAPIPELEDDVLDLDAAPPAAETAERPLSTREVIEQARATARATQETRGRPVEVRARLDRRAASGRLFNGFGGKPRRGSSALQTALMVAGGAAFLSVGAAGVVLMEGPKPDDGAVGGPAFGAGPRAAVAIAPAPAAHDPGRAAAAAPSAEEARFAQAVRAAEAGKPGGLADLKAIADGGYPPAQFYLAQLYEAGRLGVVVNMAEARRWTARAAEGGERNAMHNLGLYYFRGEGGPQDLASAAQWFRKAASLGVVDSQYNLGLMYQAGSGVQKDEVEALKWFRLAGEQGDGLARAAAEALEAALPPAEVTQADAAVSAESARRILQRLGYYDGRADAAAPDGFKAALAEFQRDQGAPATGALDPKTVALLSVYQR